MSSADDFVCVNQDGSVRELSRDERSEKLARHPDTRRRP
jgi:hypothetical protein